MKLLNIDLLLESGDGYLFMTSDTQPVKGHFTTEVLKEVTCLGQVYRWRMIGLSNNLL